MENKVKTVLITQPEPADGKSPFFEIKEKFKVSFTFRSFTQVDPVSARDFRKDKVEILNYTAIILSSRTAIEHLFRLVAEMRIELPAEMKYYCVTDGIALYLQKFITYRKRKVFYPKTKEQDIYDLLMKHKNENYLLPCSNVAQNEILDFLKKNSLKYQEAVIYKTVSSDLSDLAEVKYDVLAFFTPTAIKSLYDNFPDFIQDKTRIAAFGTLTKQAIIDAGLRLDIEAPTPEAPSMKMALENYIKKANK